MAVAYSDPRAFPDNPQVTDREWIRFACDHGWVCLTHDRATRTAEDTLDEVFVDRQPSGALFILRGGIPSSKLAEMFLAALPRVERLVHKHRKNREPFVGVIRRTTIKGGRERVEATRYANRQEWQAKKRRRRRR